jgi:Esterase-like activity of phytase/Bacterial Ig domain
MFHATRDPQRPRSRNVRRLVVGATTLVATAGVLGSLVLVSASAGKGAPAHDANQRLAAVPDRYTTPNVGTLAVHANRGILANDSGDVQLISHTDTADGSLSLQPDGSFGYVPQAGFTGDDTFSYTVADAVHLLSDNLPPLGTFGGVSLNAGGFGSSMYPVPGKPGEFYGLEDRGPNVTAADGNDVEPIPTFDPAIGKFRFVAGKAELLKEIPLKDAKGHPYSGLVGTQNPTGEVIEDLQGNQLAQDPNGYDSEGLVAMPNGTFWVSDEYGPFITHFSPNGRALERLSPLDGSLPKELVNRVPNRGMEGLTITPYGRMLVGIMQSALQQTDLNGSNAKNIVPVRIVTYDLRTSTLHEYLFLLDDPKADGTAVSEIAAVSNDTFLVDERDGNFPAAGGYKKLWKVSLDGATDVGPRSHVQGATYDAARGGLLIGGKTIEALTVGEKTADAAATLQQAGITPVSSKLFLDVDALLLSLDPQGRFYSHDKVEGVAVLNGGRQIVISNDSDFGIAGVTNDAPPWQLESKLSPAKGQQDNGEYLEIDMDKVSPSTSAAQTSTATATIHVTSG